MTNQNRDILVSVCMVTYNHEKFIVEAIESVVSQKTDFAFELIISEDCGPDSTREICKEYQRKYPKIIKLNFREKNVGAQQNVLNTIEMGQGKYIALCEGDDYWTDVRKLQKQVDYLEQNPHLSMCAHAAQIRYNESDFVDSVLDKSEFALEDIILQHWGMMTASIMFHKALFVPPTWFVEIRNGDMGLQLLMALKGNIGYLPDKMSVYRQHPGGISSTLKPLNQTAWLCYLLKQFNDYTNKKYSKLLRERVRSMYPKQIYYATYYQLRKVRAVLQCLRMISPIAPFFARHLRK